MKFSPTPLFLALTLISTSLSVSATDSLTWSGSVTAEREHDSSVGLDQVDDVSRESDYSKQLKAALGMKWQATKNWQLATSLQGKNKVYDQFSEYDLNQQHLTLSTKYSYAGTGYSYRFDGVKAKIDGDDFLNFSQSSLAIDRLIDSEVYLRASISANKKDYIELDDRDAKATIVGLDSMMFSNNGSSHVSLNVSLENETAQVELFDNNTINLNSAFQHKFKQAYFPTTFVTGVRFSRKTYENFDIESANDDGGFLTGWQPQEVIIENRVDMRLQWMASLDIELTEWLGLLIKTSYVDNDSNYEAVVYEEQVTSLGLSARF